MQKLVSKTSILFESKLYAPGKELPTKNPIMVDAWLNAGTAVWINDEETKNTVKAISATAEPGLSGVSTSSESETGEDLVGKVPKTRARKK